jgi:hypothetical protein
VLRLLLVLLLLLLAVQVVYSSSKQQLLVWRHYTAQAALCANSLPTAAAGCPD